MTPNNTRIELTEQHLKDLEVWKERFTKIGLLTEPGDFVRAERAITELYALFDLKTPAFVRCQSPKEAKDLIEKSNNKAFPFYSYFQGQLDAYWIAFYKFTEHIGVVFPEKELKILNLQLEICESINMWFPYEDVCYVCDRFAEIHLNKDNKFHREDGLAVVYRDGKGIARLNGIQVPRYMVLTPKDKLDVKQILGEANVDIRREGLKLIPLDRLMKETNSTTLDSQILPISNSTTSSYELLNMDFGDNKVRRVLRMKNPSLEDTYHYERVEDDCSTVKQALAWRNGLPDYLDPKVLT